MKENVGTKDRIFRSLSGPTLMGLGYTRLGGHEGRPVGLAAMIAGALVIEGAITRVCPINALLGIDTRETGPSIGTGRQPLRSDGPIVGMERPSRRISALR